VTAHALYCTYPATTVQSLDLCLSFCSLGLRVRWGPSFVQFPVREPESGLPF